MKKHSILFFPLIALIFSLLYFDPSFIRSVEFATYKSDYEWRVFNNVYCNFKTGGHCYENKSNRINAEIVLYLKILDSYKGQDQIKAYLEDKVRNTPRLYLLYNNLLQKESIKIDSIVKYREEIFKLIVLK